VADVPVGVFLSGGLDSSTVAYYMRQHSSDVHSFSIGFDDPSFDESRYAGVAARSIGTQHHLEVFSDRTASELIPSIADVLDEPMPDSSILPTYLLSRFARGSVKVALGGDGSDELLMGYRAYQALKVAWSADTLPWKLRAGISSMAGKIPVPARVGTIPRKARRLALMMAQSPGQRLLGLLSSFDGDARWVLSAEIRQALSASVFDGLNPTFTETRKGSSSADTTIAAYVKGYLAEDILVKVDRASMAVSLEVRSPFLDADLIDFIATIPAELKLRGMTGKYLLRRLMRDRLPDEIIDRRKMGFGVPMNRWLSTSLSPLLHDYLAPARLQAAGVFDVTAVTALVKAQTAGRSELGQQLWFLLLFELWRERWLGGSSAPETAGH
jgi:asparagine synthase (glutamine-hydrolysing)